MNQQKMFAEEQYIRNLRNSLGSAITYEKERYKKYKAINPSSFSVLSQWKDRIVNLIKIQNFLTSHLTDYTLQMPGVLKYMAQADKLVANANITLHYLQQLYAQRARKEAAVLAEVLAYEIMGDQVNELLPVYRENWRKATDAEYTIHEAIFEERRKINE